MPSEMREPICIFELGENTVEAAADLDNNSGEPELEEILCREDVKNLPVVVISVAGRFRQGKSFLLNFMIRYLEAGGNLEWSSELAGDLRGFAWKNTRHRVTQGVLIWPEVFKLSLPDSKTVAVVLMDTQGVFDTVTTVKDSTRIFSFSVLSSSVQVFNLKNQINGDDLGHLELFSQYGKLLLDSGSKPVQSSKTFQDIVFLVRDWSYASTIPYGWQGGQSVLEEELDKDGLDGELSSMRENIKNSFSSFRCFLMPYPGEKVDTSQEFRGSYNDIETDFLENMQLFLQGLLSPSKLVPKKINGEYVTLQEWCSHVEVYGRHLRSADLPTPKTLLEATMDATNTTVLKTCTDLYYNGMVNLLDRDSYDEHVLFEKHRELSNKAVKMFRLSLKMGNQDLWRKLEDELIKKLTSVYDEHFLKLNQNRLQMKRTESRLKDLGQQSERLREEFQNQIANAEEIKMRLAQIEAESAERQKLDLAEAKALDEKRELLREDAKNQMAITEEIEKKLTQVEADSAAAKQEFDQAKKEYEKQLRDAKNEKKGLFRKFCGFIADTVSAIVDVVSTVAAGVAMVKGLGIK